MFFTKKNVINICCVVAIDISQMSCIPLVSLEKNSFERWYSYSKGTKTNRSST